MKKEILLAKDVLKYVIRYIYSDKKIAHIHQDSISNLLDNSIQNHLKNHRDQECMEFCLKSYFCTFFSTKIELVGTVPKNNYVLCRIHGLFGFDFVFNTHFKYDDD